MIQIPAGNLMSSASLIGSTCKYLQITRRQLRNHEHDQALVSAADLGAMAQGAGFLRSVGASLGFVACSTAADRLADVVDRLPVPRRGEFALSEHHLDELIGALEYLLQTFRDELDSRPMFVALAGSVPLLEQREPPFGAAVEDAFPSSALDIAEAAHCLGLERYTACTMHLMRALETPLGVLADRVGVPDAANWNSLLNQIEARLRDRANPAGSPDDEQWLAEVATHFRLIKNAWRNHAMHARQCYDQVRATEIYGSVGAFLRQLSEHLQERQPS